MAQTADEVVLRGDEAPTAETTERPSRSTPRGPGLTPATTQRGRDAQARQWQGSPRSPGRQFARSNYRLGTKVATEEPRLGWEGEFAMGFVFGGHPGSR
jgi:hypothetical protein